MGVLPAAWLEPGAATCGRSPVSAVQINLPAQALPPHCEVLVVGAGPAGSAAARCLAQAGLDVVLVDHQVFPRDKVCGDALIPDAHRALERLGLLDPVLAQAESVAHVAVTGPRGGRLRIPGRLAVLPRRVLDELLCRAAVQAGARMFAPLRFVAPLEQAGASGARVVGAVLQSGDTRHELKARWVLLATGAQPQALQAAGMALRRTPSGMSLRGYLRNTRLHLPEGELDMVWHQQLRSGYGWVFPGPGGVFNVGVYLTDSHMAGRDGRHRMQDINLRESLQTFCQVHPHLRELIATGEWLGEPKGAPVRCSLEGATPTRPGLMVIGEAVGTTYLLSGEGIGKALETGMLAAEAVLAGNDDAAAQAHYERGLAALTPHYEAYRRGNLANHRPWLVDLLVWSSRRSPRRQQKLAAVLDERHTPRSLMSAGSWWRLLTAQS